MIDYPSRLEGIRGFMEEQGIGGFMLSPSGDAEWLTGIRRQRPNATHSHYPGDWLYGLWGNQKEAVYVSPSLPLEFVKSQVADKDYVTDIMVMPNGHDSHASACKIVDRLGLAKGRLAIPKTALSKTLVNLKALFPEMSFTCTEDYTLKRRMIKTDDELSLMRKAAEITDKVFYAVFDKLKVGMSEIEVANEVDLQMLIHGTEGSSFITGIMVRGQGTPQNIEGIGRIGGTKLEPGKTLSFDFGVVLDGYVSDFGRTVYIGQPTKRMLEVHKLVMDSQQAGMKALIPGKHTAEEINQIARKIIEDAGLKKEFFHRLGHGIGVDVHEYPFLDKGYIEPIQENMTFTVEPSILIPEELWIRVEDVVHVTPEGGRSFNQVSWEPMIIE